MQELDFVINNQLNTACFKTDYFIVVTWFYCYYLIHIAFSNFSQYCIFLSDFYSAGFIVIFGWC